MALNKPQLKTSIRQLFDAAWNNQDNPEQAREDFSAGLANAIDAFVKSGQVNVTVATTGTASAQTGSGTGTIS